MSELERARALPGPALLPPRGTRVLVAGGCGGIGRAFVEAALAADLRVIVIDQPSALAQGVPTGVEAIACNATDEAQVDQAFSRVASTWGALDAMINLVGYTKEQIRVEDMPVAEWDEIVGACLRSQFLVARRAVPMIRTGREQGFDPAAGGIVLTASTFGVRVQLQGYGPYASAKGGVITLCKALAVECAPAIRVNVLAPGAVDTAFLQGGTGRVAKQGRLDVERYVAQNPLKRLGTASDMVGPLLFMLSPAAAYMNGQTMHVNGGNWAA